MFWHTSHHMILLQAALTFKTQGRVSPFSLWNMNTGFHLRNIRSSSKDIIHSRLQPGSEGDCVSMILLFGKTLSWYSLPCDKVFERGYICKRLAETAPRPLPYHATSNASYNKCAPQEVYAINDCYLLNYTTLGRLDVENFIPNFVKKYFIRLFASLNNMTSLEYHLRWLPDDTELTNSQDHPCTYVTSNEIYNTTCFSSNTSKSFYVQHRGMSRNICELNQIACDDGTCILQEYQCSDHFSCIPKINAGFNDVHLANEQYCSHICMPDICVCKRHYFQCSSGGCIQFTLICDGKADCIDASDEMCGTEIGLILQQKMSDRAKLWTGHQHFCLGYQCLSGECIPLHHVNDLLVDCPGGQGEDEQQFVNMLYHDEKYVCEDNNYHPCVTGLPICFPLNKLCLFDSDDRGDLLWCRNGAHLGDCAHINCTNSYKCPESYCIPLHRVCNGKPDCIHGEDEQQCDDHICKGLLRCQSSRICVHPDHLCDGKNHCPGADDEKYCDLKPCETNCTCVAYSTICTDIFDKPLPSLQSTHIKHVTVTRSYIPNPDFGNICNQKEIAYLNLSGNYMTNICRPLGPNCALYEKVYLLDLSYNAIRTLGPSCFKKLTYLKILILAYNPLQYINHAFVGLSLEYLSIKHTKISEITRQTFSGISRIKILNMNHIHLRLLEEYAEEDILLYIRELRFNDPRLCCLFSHMEICREILNIWGVCPTILPNRKVSYIIILIGLVSMSVNSISLPIHAMSSKDSCHANVLSHQLIFNTFVATYMPLIGSIDVYYGQHFVLSHDKWYDSILCHFMEVSSSTTLSLALFLNALSMFLTVQVVTRIGFHIDKRKMLLVEVLVSLLVFTLNLMLLFLKANQHGPQDISCNLCNILGVSKIRSLAEILSTVFTCLIMIALLTYMLYGAITVILHINKTTQEVQKYSTMDIDSRNTRNKAVWENIVGMVLVMSSVTLPYPLLMAASVWYENIPRMIYASVMFSTIISQTFYCPIVFVCKPMWSRISK